MNCTLVKKNTTGLCIFALRCNTEYYTVYILYCASTAIPIIQMRQKADTLNTWWVIRSESSDMAPAARCTYTVFYNIIEYYMGHFSMV